MAALPESMEVLPPSCGVAYWLAACPAIEQSPLVRHFNFVRLARCSLVILMHDTLRKAMRHGHLARATTRCTCWALARPSSCQADSASCADPAVAAPAAAASAFT